VKAATANTATTTAATTATTAAGAAAGTLTRVQAAADSRTRRRSLADCSITFAPTAMQKPPRGITTYEVHPARPWWAMPLLFGENVHVTYSPKRTAATAPISNTRVTGSC
jgi:hypothetical protein